MTDLYTNSESTNPEFSGFLSNQIVFKENTIYKWKTLVVKLRQKIHENLYSFGCWLWRKRYMYWTENFLAVWHHWNAKNFKFDFIKNLVPLCKAIALDSNPHFKIKKCDKVPTNYNCVSCMLVCNHIALWTILCQKPQKSFKRPT